MIDFSTVTGVTVPEGVVTKIECGGVVLWERISDTVILEVEKITSDTYANSTTYTGEQFILLNIYPKTNGTVNVTYGGLTKTITDTSGADEPSAQKVFFGTFNGVSDEVTTPTSGTLTISGDYRGFAMCSFSKSKSLTAYCGCVVSVVDWSNVEIIPNNAFYSCTALTSITIPSGVTSISGNTFYGCTSLTSIDIPSDVTSIDTGAFYGCTSLTSIDIPSGVTSISGNTFYGCTSLTSIDIPSGVTSIGGQAFYGCTSLTSVTIPSGVTSIESAAFRLSSGKRVVTMLPTTPPSLGDNAFAESGTNYIVVPAGCGAAYKTGDWYRYADYITEASA